MYVDSCHELLQYLHPLFVENGLQWYDFPVLIDTEVYIMASIPICCILFVYTITIFLLLTIYFDRVFSKPYAPSITWAYLWKVSFTKTQS